MVRYLMRICYIGTKYRGSQKMPDFPYETVQDVVESALQQSLFPSSFPTTYFASRTDKGVHAIMNAFHVDLQHKIPGEVYQPHLIKKEINSYLMENNHEILVTNASIVPDSFHARFHAKRRAYFYRIAVLKPEVKINFSHKASCEEYLPVSEIHRCHVVPSELNTSTVKEVANLFCGAHDFSSFTKLLNREPGRDPWRIIDECKFYESPYQNFMADPQFSNITIWEFYIKSKSFLYHQVRKLVGTALSAGFGLLSLDDVQLMLDKPGSHMWVKSHLTPSHGLYLANIEYDKEDLSDFMSNQCLVASQKNTNTVSPQAAVA